MAFKVLRENTDFSTEINPDDRACYTCYKSHLVTVRHLNGTTQSTDTNLQEFLKKITDSLPSISDVTTIESALSYTSNLVAIHVGETLLKNNALLLLEFNELFHNRLQEVLLPCNIKPSSDSGSMMHTPAWLTSQLSSILEPHMAYQCSVKSCCTVLYRYGVGLFYALNVALGQV